MVCHILGGVWIKFIKVIDCILNLNLYLEKNKNNNKQQQQQQQKRKEKHTTHSNTQQT